jgi:hypothetical protein
MKELLSGNEAMARGAYESGVKVATGYPGTPSTEILEAVASFKPAIYCEWSPNEKVAMEVAVGASLAGARAIVTSQMVVPLTVSSGTATYPADVEVRIRRCVPRLISLDAVGLAGALGNMRASNAVVLGAI